MHITVISDSVDVGSEIVKLIATCSDVKQITYVDTPDELFEVTKQFSIDLIFIFLEHSDDNAALLLADIINNFPDLLRKVAIISPQSKNLNKNHLIETTLRYPLEDGIICQIIDDFFNLEEDPE